MRAGHDLVVVKIGSSTLVKKDGSVDHEYIRGLCNQVSDLKQRGFDVVIVTSGAAAVGRERLGFTAKPKDVPSLQACAAAGQAALTEAYAEILAERGIPCGQVLLTRRDVTDREGYLNARNTLERLLELGAVPVVNENDTVSVTEFAFGDNDTLGAIVAAILGASLYIILSDVEGLYTSNPQSDPDARLISHLDGVTTDAISMAGDSVSGFGTGGMASKLRAARAISPAGIPTVICHGRRKGVVLAAVNGEEVGTRIEPAQVPSKDSGRKLWIGLASLPKGTLVVDDGAMRAIKEQGASLLPVGVTQVRGDFVAGDVVNVVDSQDVLIGRGLARYSSDEMVRVRGLKLDVIARFMPEKDGQPCIHRDEFLVF